MKLESAVRQLHLENEEVPDNVTHFIPVTKNHLSLRKWAANNAWTLAFIMVMHGITWIILFLIRYGVV